VKLGVNYEPYAFVGSGDQDDIVGALAIIRRTTDGKLYFPAKNDTQFPHYYARKSATAIDLTDVLILTEEQGQPTIATINADSTYVIERGTVRVTGKAENGINCFGAGTVNAPAGIIVKSLLREEINPEVMAKLTALLAGNASNRITGENHRIRGRMFLTSEVAANNISTLTVREEGGKQYFYIDTVRQVIGANEVAFWVEYNADGRIRIKEIIAGDSFDQGLATALKAWDAQLEWKQKTFFEKFLSVSYDVVDGYFTMTYDMLDMLSSGIGKLKIPPSVYNCNATDGSYNPIYAEIFSYLNIASVIQDVVAQKLVEAYPELAPLIANGEPSQIQFALFCGVYNGLIDVVKSVPDLAKLLVSPLSSKGRQANSEFINSISDKEIYEERSGVEVLVHGKGITFGKLWYLLKDGVASQFSTSTPCVTAEFVGSIAGPIIVMCIGDVEAGAGIMSRVASTTFRILQVCDKLADPFHYVGLSFRFLKKAGGKIGIIVRQGTSDVITQLDNGLFKVRVFAGSIEYPNLELSFEQVNSLVAAGANGINHTVDGVERRIVLSGSVGSVGGATLETISRQVFGTAAESLLQRFTALGLDAARVERVMNALGKNIPMGEQLADFVENVAFKGDIYKLRGLFDDLAASADIQTLFRQGADFTTEWEVLFPFLKLRKVAANLNKVKAVLAKGHISRADLETVLSVNSGLGARATGVPDFLDDLDNFAKFRDRPGFDKVITGLKANWFNGAGADGANWVIAVLKKEGDNVFPPSKTSFEITKAARRYDAIVDEAVTINNQLQPKHFEFKSYSSVAPSNFNTQFVNDLNNTDIIDLKQLVWIFDAAKNPPDFVTNMTRAIDNLPAGDIPAATLTKFGVTTVPQLKAKIKAQFTSIIQYK
jgi:hypothetical protein